MDLVHLNIINPQKAANKSKRRKSKKKPEK
jgi:hypothetical protein